MTSALYKSGIRNDLNFGIGPKSNQISSKILKRLPMVPIPKKPGIGRLKVLELIYSGHLSIHDFSVNLNDFREYKTFALVRNPYAWLVSIFTFVNKVKNHPYRAMNPDRFLTFENFIKYQCEKPSSQLGYIRDSTGCLGDVKTFKLETISKSLPKLSTLIGAEISARFEKKNFSSNKHYSEFYSKKLKAMVEKAYKLDLNKLEYEFNDNK